MSGFDEDYFRTLYGEAPRQTWFDRARDDRVVRLVDRFAPRRDGRALLDIGCGYGYLLARFRGGFELFGVDVSAHGVKVTSERLDGVLVVQADLQRPLPFNRRFEVILAINVVEHLPDPRAGVRSLNEALVPGGVCVVHLPTINNWVSRAIYRFTYAGDPTHVYRPSGAAVRAMFEEEGFETLDDGFAPFRPKGLWNALRWHPAYLAAFRRSVAGNEKGVDGIVIYGADWCGDCRRAKRLLDDRRVPYRWIDVEADPLAADEARRISGRPNIPVVVMPDGSILVEPSNLELERRLSG